MQAQKIGWLFGRPERREQTLRTQSVDTSEEAEQVQIELLRRAGPLRRFQQLRSLTASNRQMSWLTLRKLRPHLSRLEAALFFVELLYGKPLALALSQALADKRKRDILNCNSSSNSSNVWEEDAKGSSDNQTAPLEDAEEGFIMIAHDVVLAIAPIVTLLEQLGIPYLIGGSVASSVFGIPRSTNDADLVAQMRAEHVKPFLDAIFPDDYYVSETAMREALVRRSSFNLIHQATMIKLDIFISKNDPFDLVELARVVRSPLNEVATDHKGAGELSLTVSPPLPPLLVVNLASPEDLILRKLAWYRSGGETSERQWLDVLGILKMQAGNLDQSYMREWAGRLEVSDLLERVSQEAK